MTVSTVGADAGTKKDTKPGQRSYWDERLRQHWGLHGVGALAYGRYYNGWLYRLRRRAFASTVRSLTLDFPRLRVLDVGCGTGFYLHLWREHGTASLSGLDFSSVAIERLRRELPEVDLHESDIAEVTPPFPAGSFDVISAFDVLFHIIDDARYEQALRNIAMMLKHRGYFLCSDAFPRQASRECLDYWKARRLEDVERILDRTGFDVLARIPVFVLMNSPVDIQSRLYQRVWDLSMKVVRRSEVIGFVIGALLYPFELLLRKVVREGPSTEIMVCRKR